MLPDEDSLWGSIRLGEIKAMLYLALKEPLALDWVEWCLTLEDITEQQLKHYRCVKALLEIKWHEDRDYNDYLKGLETLYGKQTAQAALAIVEGSNVFEGLTSPGKELRGLERHQHLLIAYKKLQNVKLS